MEFTIAKCGLACEVCQYFINRDCLGCVRENELNSKCLIFTCAKKKKIKYCLQCSEFPCEFMCLSKTYCPVFSKIKFRRLHKVSLAIPIKVIAVE